MKYRAFIILAIAFVASMMLSSCIEDGFTTASSDQPSFSSDTIDLGDTYTLNPTPTKRFTVYNRHSKMLNISTIALRDDADNLFRLNVDGISGREFHNVEIRPNDSIFVFVEATLPENNLDEPVTVNRILDFITNGVTRSVTISLTGQDVVRLDDFTITADTRFTADRPYLISDTLRVAHGATLTIDAGSRLRFRNEAAIKVEGTIIANGTPEKQIDLTGDRMGNVAADIPYDLMSGQWGGIYIGPQSEGNRLTCTVVRNSSDGITLATPARDYTTPTLTMTDCVVRNTTNYVIDSSHANLTLIGCELAEASSGILRLIGGNHILNHCTISNNYLFTAVGGPALQLSHIDSESDDLSGLPYMKALITNTIIYGIGNDLSHGDLTGTQVFLNRCLLKSNGTDDDNFINCLWGEDPMFYTVRNDYLFDYRLKPDSPAIHASDPALDIYGLTHDRYGVTFATPASLGCYAYIDLTPQP